MELCWKYIEMGNGNPGIFPSFGFLTSRSLVLEVSVTGSVSHQGGIEGRMSVNMCMLQADLELVILLPPPSKCWHYVSVSSLLAGFPF